jgi:hypothetical protein
MKDGNINMEEYASKHFKDYAQYSSEQGPPQKSKRFQDTLRDGKSPFQ